jgi:hypothetical protein
MNTMTILDMPALSPDDPKASPTRPEPGYRWILTSTNRTLRAALLSVPVVISLALLAVIVVLLLFSVGAHGIVKVARQLFHGQ